MEVLISPKVSSRSLLPSPLASSTEPGNSPTQPLPNPLLPNPPPLRNPPLSGFHPPLPGRLSGSRLSPPPRSPLSPLPPRSPRALSSPCPPPHPVPPRLRRSAHRARAAALAPHRLHHPLLPVRPSITKAVLQADWLSPQELSIAQRAPRRTWSISLMCSSRSEALRLPPISSRCTWIPMISYDSYITSLSLGSFLYIFSSLLVSTYVTFYFWEDCGKEGKMCMDGRI